MADWKQYYKNMEGRAPRPFFLEALEVIDLKQLNPNAIDLGCGDGTESLYLLEQGWRVSAIDAEASAIQNLFQKCKPDLRQNLKGQVSSFEKATLPQADFIYAGLSLPFCHPDNFQSIWQKIQTALTQGGYFAGHFFGLNDGWADIETMTFFDRRGLEGMLEPFDINLVRELEEDGKTASGLEKHWHYFEVIVKKQ